MDEQNVGQESQKDALKNNELPQGTLRDTIPVEEYQKENEQVKDKLAEFGETDLEHFMSKVTSDSVYGKRVIRKMLGLDGDQPFVDLKHRTSPQEKNLTGVLDHSSYPPMVKGGPEGKTSETVKVADAA